MSNRQPGKPPAPAAQEALQEINAPSHALKALQEWVRYFDPMSQRIARDFSSMVLEDYREHGYADQNEAAWILKRYANLPDDPGLASILSECVPVRRDFLELVAKLLSGEIKKPRHRPLPSREKRAIMRLTVIRIEELLAEGHSQEAAFATIAEETTTPPDTVKKWFQKRRAKK